MTDAPITELIVTRQHLAAALLRWEQDARAGLTRSHAEADSLPIEQVVDESTEFLWALLASQVAA